MQWATRVVRAGRPAAAQGEPFLPGPEFIAPVHLAGDPAGSPYVYGRYGNPTWTRYEEALGELEGGEAVVFASGMAAVCAVLETLLAPGDALVISADGYFSGRVFADTHLAKIGVEVRHVPTADLDGNATGALIGATLVLVETPSNPGLDVCDIEALTAAAHAAGALVAVDNTTATVLGQQPLALGADFSVASDTKALSGHSDVVLGHVAVRDADHAQMLRSWRTVTGAIAGPMEVWLAHRSLATAELRQQRQHENAIAVAEMLTTHPAVIDVRYPGLDSDPAYETASRQMRFFGPIVSFTLAGREEAERFLAACELVDEATSFGGVHSTAERRARWGGDAVPEGFVRLSVGCEAGADIVADVEQALWQALSSRD